MWSQLQAIRAEGPSWPQIVAHSAEAPVLLHQASTVYSHNATLTFTCATACSACLPEMSPAQPACLINVYSTCLAKCHLPSLPVQISSHKAKTKDDNGAIGASPSPALSETSREFPQRIKLEAMQVDRLQVSLEERTR